MKSTAYSYIRFSSTQQSSGDSLQRQLKATQKYCEENDLILSDKSFRDLGISGFKGVERPELNELITLVNNHTIKKGDYIIIESLDRLSRKGISNTQEMLNNILKMGVYIVILHDNVRLDSNSLNDLSTVIIIAVGADLAHKESLKKSIRVQSAKDKIKQLALSGTPIAKRLPFWLEYKVIDNKPTYQFTELKWIAEKVIKLRLMGYGMNKIAIEMNNEKAMNKVWYRATVAKIINAPAIYGSYQMMKRDETKTDIVSNYYPPLCTAEEFKVMQSDKVKNIGGSSSSLSGLLKCGVCGSGMSVVRGAKHNKWLCLQSRVKACDNKSSVPFLDTVIKNKLAFHLQPTDIQAIDKDLLMLDSEILDCENMISTTTKIIAELTDISTLSVMAKKLETLNIQLTNLKAKKDDITDNVITTPIISDTTNVLKNELSTPGEINKALKNICSSITVHTIKPQIKWKLIVCLHNSNNNIEIIFRRKHKNSTEIMYILGKDIDRQAKHLASICNELEEELQLEDELAKLKRDLQVRQN